MSTDLPFDSKEAQILLINYMLSDETYFSRCQNILDKSYFDHGLDKTVEFILEYAEKYNTIPSKEIVQTATKFDAEIYDDINKNRQEWFLEQTEKFCRYKAVAQTVYNAPDLLQKGEYGALEQQLKDALLISLNKNLGSNFFTDFERTLKEMKENNGTQSTGYRDIDKILYGGFNRGELNVFLAKSGGGKSLVMQNIALNWAAMGLHVVYVSLELSEALINKRLGSMFTGVPQSEIMKKIEETALKIGAKSKGLGGSLINVQMPQGSTTNDIKAYLKEYEIAYGYSPDAIVVDYLDIMYPNNKRINPGDLFIKDKFVSEELRGLAIEKKMLLVTASQVNREGMNELEFDYTHIAGGVSKINTADNVLGILMTEAMKNRGEMQIQFLKTRSSGGNGAKIYLNFDQETLLISNKEEDDADSDVTPSTSSDIMDKLRRSAKQSQSNNTDTETSSGPIVGSNSKKIEDAISRGNKLRQSLLGKG